MFYSSFFSSGTGIRDLFVLLGIALISSAIWTFVYQLFFSPLRKIPGPFFARFTQLWELYDVVSHHCEETYLRLHEKHGN